MIFFKLNTYVLWSNVVLTSYVVAWFVRWVLVSPFNEFQVRKSSRPWDYVQYKVFVLADMFHLYQFRMKNSMLSLTFTFPLTIYSGWESMQRVTWTFHLIIYAGWWSLVRGKCLFLYSYIEFLFNSMLMNAVMDWKRCCSWYLLLLGSSF